MKTPAFIFACILAVASLASAIPNPAAEFCVKCGYKSEIRTDPQGGQYGVCVFPDGSECDEWAYYRKCNAPQNCEGDCNCPWPCPKRIIYVDDDANGLNDGSSWLNAYNFLQGALADANSSPKLVEIRVAQGIYRPDRGAGISRGERKTTFQLKNGVTIKGGYAGFNKPDPNARDINEYKTILSGDLDGNDVEVKELSNLLAEPTRGENSYHVVTGSGTDKTAVLDGFVITGGNANEPSPPPPPGTGRNGNPPDDSWIYKHGAGMFNYGYIIGASPTLLNCVFTANTASNPGGGMYNAFADPTLINCEFNRNFVVWGGGGGMWNDRSSPILIDCIFSQNLSGFGYGGGIGNFYMGTNPSLINCTFSRNSARYEGGGVWNDRSSPTVTNCIFWGNSRVNGDIGEATQIYQSEGSLIINYSCIQGWTGILGGVGNMSTDPLFADPNNDDYHLKSQAGRWDPNSKSWVKDDVTSPCIDAGDSLSPIMYEPFPNGGVINTGAYGGTAEASKSYFGKPPCETIVAGDINGDCIVDFKDFALMAFHWLEEHQ